MHYIFCLHIYSSWNIRKERNPYLVNGNCDWFVYKIQVVIENETEEKKHQLGFKCEHTVKINVNCAFDATIQVSLKEMKRYLNSVLCKLLSDTHKASFYWDCLYSDAEGL